MKAILAQILKVPALEKLYVVLFVLLHILKEPCSFEHY